MKSVLLLAISLLAATAYGQNEIITPPGQPLKVGINGLKLANLTSDSPTQAANGKVLTVDNTGTVFLAPYSSQWTTAGGAVYYSGSGLTNVGIGTTTPQQKLDVNGSINLSAGTYMLGNATVLKNVGIENIYVGVSAGAGSTGNYNSFFGVYSGMANTNASRNTFIGASAGLKTTTGGTNTFVGVASGLNNLSGTGNSYLGFFAGQSNESGTYNLAVGLQAGYLNSSGSYNTFLGSRSGENNLSGSRNVFLGYGAGFNELGSQRLYISNSSSATPLIYGEFDNKKLVFNGKVGVSTATFPTTVGGVDISAYMLFVKGGILAEEVRVNTGWADYVFGDNYKLKRLSEVEAFICKNGHLPGVPSASQVKEQGIGLGNIASIQQEKIEELTLYAIGQEKKIEAQATYATRQEKRIDDQNERLLAQQKDIEEMRGLLERLTKK